MRKITPELIAEAKANVAARKIANTAALTETKADDYVVFDSVDDLIAAIEQKD